MDMNRLKEIQAGLLDVTAGCRPDMHEPGEQDLKAHVVGDHLDNAFGANVAASMVIAGTQEYVVCLERFDGTDFHVAQVNLADLIAMARLAKLDVRPAEESKNNTCA